MKRITMKNLIPVLSMPAVMFAVVAAFALNGHVSASPDYDAMRANWVNMLTGTANGGIPINYNDTDIKTRLGNIRGTGESYWNNMEKNPTSYLWSDLPGTDISTTLSAYERLWRMSLAWATSGQTLYQNAALQADIAMGLNWMNQNRYNTSCRYVGSWYTWEIAIPMTLSNILAVNYNHLYANHKPLLQAQISAVNRFCPKATISPAYYIPSIHTTAQGFLYDGANGAWRARVRTVIGIVTKQNVTDFPDQTFYAGPTNDTNDPIGPSSYSTDMANDLPHVRSLLDSQFAMVSSGEGLYADGTFIAHVAHPYNGGYGNAWMGTSAEILALLNGPGSIWSMTPTDGSNFPTFCAGIFKAYEPIIYKGDLMDMFRGREVARSSNQDSSAGSGMIRNLARLVEVPHVTQENVDSYKSMIRRWATAGNPGVQLNAQAGIYWGQSLGMIMRLKECINSAQITTEPVGNHRFVRGDRVVHRGNNFMFGVAMFSTRVNNYEFGNGENKKGFFLGTGATYLYNDDFVHYNDAHWPTIDPLRISGTTVQNRARADGTAGNMRSTKNAVGMTGNGRFGVACMDLSDPISKTQYSALTGKKSWFMFDDEIVCIGTGISNGGDSWTVETIVENRKITPTATASTSANTTINTTATALPATHWAYLDSDGEAGKSIGYYFPNNPTNLKAKHQEARTGSWRNLHDSGSTTALNANFFTLWFDHGASPSGATSMYQYVLLPNKTRAAVETYSSNPDISVLSADASGVCVREQANNITGFVNWADASTIGGFITVNKKACVLVDESESEYLSVALSDPTQANTGTISVTLAGKQGLGGVVSSDPGITVTSLNPITFTVNVNGSLGRTYNARFHSPSQVYAVTYLANGATGGTVPTAQTKIHDVALTLATNSGGLVRTGYTFSGWNTAANGSGTTYATGASYTTNAPLTLYAKWTNLAPTVATPAAASPNPVTGLTSTLNVLGADDGGEAALTYTWAATGSPPAPVSFSVNGTNAAKTTVATFAQPGSYTLQCTIRDVPGLTSATPVTVTVAAPNQAPVAHAQSVSMQQGEAKSLTLTGSDLDGNPLTYSIVTQPSNGALTGIAPAVVYTPAAGYSGADSFTFKVNDGTADSPPATIAITVTPDSGWTPWTPARLNLLAWYDANDATTITSSGGAVSQWNDKSGNNHHATQTNSTLRPTLDAGGILFGTNNRCLNIPKMSADAHSVMMVLQNNSTITSSSAPQMPLSIEVLSSGPGFGSTTTAYANEVLSIFDEEGIGVFLDRQSASSAQLPSISTAPHSYSFVLDGNWHIGIDGSPNKLDLTSGTRHPFYVSRQVGAIGINIRKRPSENIVEHPWTGLICEIALLPSALSETDRQKMEGYFAHKWDAINGNNDLVTALPASHPWKSSAPGNHPPTAASQAVTADKNQSVAITLSGADADGDALTFTVVANPSSGALTGTPPDLTYTPATNFAGTDTFLFKTNDGIADSAEAMVTIDVLDPTWTPARLNLLAWYDADDSASITSSGGAVSQWGDKSGNNRHISQSVASQRPALSASTVSFDGSNDFLMHNAAFMYAAGSVDVYIVAAVSPDADRRLVSENNSNNNAPLYNLAQTRNSNGSILSSYIRNDANAVRFDNASQLSAAGMFSRSTPNIYQWSDTGLRVSGRVAGGTDTGVNYTRSGAITLDRFTVGAIGPRSSGSTAGSMFANAGINEVIICPNLGSADRQKIEGYLAHKWDGILGGSALVTALPSNHPWKSQVPSALAFPTYDLWASGYDGYDLADATADADGDGLSNFHEFAFGLDPTDGNVAGPVISPIDTASRRFSYQRAVDSGLAYVVEVSSDLISWSAVADLTQKIAATEDPEVEVVEVTLGSVPDTPNVFLRVRAE